MSDVIETSKYYHEPTKSTVRVEILYDDNYGAPEMEEDGHGVVTTFDYPFAPTDIEALMEHMGWQDDGLGTPEEMECIAQHKMLKPLGHGYRHHSIDKYYDVWSTLKIAREQGWGSAENTDELLAAVMRDYDYINGWYCDDWHWAYVRVVLLGEDGEETEHSESYGGISWGWEDNSADLFDLISEATYVVISYATNRGSKQLSLFNDLEVNAQTLKKVA